MNSTSAMVLLRGFLPFPILKFQTDDVGFHSLHIIIFVVRPEQMSFPSSGFVPRIGFVSTKEAFVHFEQDMSLMQAFWATQLQAMFPHGLHLLHDPFVIRERSFQRRSRPE